MLVRPYFKDRSDAGRKLAQKLTDYVHRPDVLVLALPRGGVPVAYEVATALHAPLDVFLVRKLGVPGHEELALGAVASGGVQVLNRELIEELGLAQSQLEAVVAKELHELERREHAYRDNRPVPEIRGRIVILVDDGLATGASMWAAVVALKQQQPDYLIAAVPIAAPQTCAAFRDDVDEIVCAVTPEPFYAVGLWYEDFGQTTDDEVRDLLAHAAQMQSEQHGDVSSQLT
jgi:putative phosphoribosyl transferase